MPRDPLAPPEPPVEYTFDRVPEPGEAIEVRPGLLWLRFPLPFQLDHVNLWALEEGDGWTLIDTGFGNEATHDLWRRAMAGPLRGRPIQRLVVTHIHPDHVGSAGWLVAQTGAPLFMSQAEFMLARANAGKRSPEDHASFADFYRRAGCDDAFVETLTGRGELYESWIRPAPSRFQRLQAGGSIRMGGRNWRIITGEGHSVEHLSFYCHSEKILIAGDQILPRISPNIAVWAFEPEADPLSRYLQSLPRFIDLPADTLVLPSHNVPFLGLQDRIGQLRMHHEERLDHVWTGCTSPMSGVDVANLLFDRELDSHQLFFAVGEALAHAHHLVSLGRLHLETGADEVVRFQRC